MKKVLFLVVIIALLIATSVFAEDSEGSGGVKSIITEPPFVTPEENLPMFGTPEEKVMDYAEENNPEIGMIELHAVEDAAEDDFNGLWVPILQYIRKLGGITSIHEAYKNDFVLIYDGNIYISILDNFFTDLPYKYEDGAVLTALPTVKTEPMYVTFRLLDENLMLYTRFFDGEVKTEFICKRVEPTDNK